MIYKKTAQVSDFLLMLSKKEISYFLLLYESISTYLLFIVFLFLLEQILFT